MTIDIPHRDILAVSDLKSRYFAYLDAKQWDRMRLIFAVDSRFEGFAFAADGLEDFISTLSSFLAGVHSQHQGFMPRFARISDDMIRGTWSMHDYLTWEPDRRVYKDVPIAGMYGIRGYGYYEEEYTRTPQGWRISFSRLVRTRIDPLVGTPGPNPHYEMMGPDTDWLSER